MYQRLPKIYVTTPRSKKQIKFPWRFVKVCIFVGILGVFAYFIFYSPYFLIQKVDVEGVQNEEILAIANKARGFNIWLFDKKKLEQELLELNEVKSASIRKWPPKTIKIKIEKRAEGIIWRTQNRKFLLDSGGVVVREVEVSDLPEVRDSKDAQVSIGEQIVSSSFINFIKNLALKFKLKTDLDIQEITVPPETIYDIIVQTNKFKVIFDSQGDLDQQLENMVKVYQMKKDEIKEYMDLRIEGRVYYK